MASEDPPLSPAAELRRQAEARALERVALAARHLEALLPEDTRHMLHELRVHQIELELQNEELRRAAVELDATRARYFDLYDLAPVGYCTLDEHGRILQANLTAATLLGITRGMLQGAMLSRFIDSQDQDVWYLHRKRLVETGEGVAFDARLVGPTGAALWAHLEAKPATELDGSKVVRLVLSDISERRGLEAASADLSSKLEQAQRLESVGRLAGGVAHDSNNLLGVIIGHAELALLQPELTPALRVDLEQIREAAQRSARLTRQLLAFASQQVVTPQELELSEVIHSHVRVLQRVIGNDVGLRVRAEAALWSVWIDPSQFDQILTNLCLNARDAMAAGGEITIDLANCTLTAGDCAGLVDAVPGEYLRMTVSDNGRGMDAHTLAHLFEPFFTTKPAWAGTGLGLASVYGSVRQNQGFIRVTSKLGEGAAFAVYLPRSRGNAARPASSSLPASLSVSSSHETVLVVEDESAFLRLVERVLTEAGYTVLTARTPSEAIRTVIDHASTIHLLLTDVVMPEMNGRDLAERLTSLRPGLKCLFMSGFTADILTTGPDGPSAKGFLQKPVSIADLTDAVRRALAQETR